MFPRLASSPSLWAQALLHKGTALRRAGGRWAACGAPAISRHTSLSLHTSWLWQHRTSWEQREDLQGWDKRGALPGAAPAASAGNFILEIKG